MVDPNDITKYNLSYKQLEEYLVFWVCVAGKKATTISAALDKFWAGTQGSPFEVLRKLGQKRIATKLKKKWHWLL